MLDEHTADRLLSGVLAPEDAPPRYAEVAALLQAARKPPTQQELARCGETVAAMAGAVASSVPVPFGPARRRAGLSRLLRPRIAATLTAGALALYGGLASAGALPGALQHAAHVILGSIGISVPDTDPGVVQASHWSGGLFGPESNPPVTPAGTHNTGAATNGDENGGSTDGSTDGSSVGPTHQGDGTSTKPEGHTHHGTSGTHPKTGGGGSPAPDETTGPQGLCNAWPSGNGGENGNKLDATAFRRLQQAAEAHGQTVEEFCEGQAGHNHGTGHGYADRGDRGGDSAKGDDDGSDHDPGPGHGDGSGNGGRHEGGSHVGKAAHSKGKASGHTRSPHHSHASDEGH